MSRTRRDILLRLARFGSKRKPWRQWRGGVRPGPRPVPIPWPGLFVLAATLVLLMLSCK
jgi:hypothetical protein